jgi:hypothetical protein
MRSDDDNEKDTNASFLSGETLKTSTTTTRRDAFLHRRNKELFVVECARRFVNNAKSTSRANKDSTKDDEDAKVSSISSSSRGGGDDGDDDDIFFFDAMYSSVHESVQRLLESETRVQSLRRKHHQSASSSSNDDTSFSGAAFALETTTPPVKKRGDGKRSMLPQIDDCAQFPSLSSSPVVATTPLAKKLGGMSLNGSSNNNINGALPSPRRVTPSPVSNGGPGSVERAASPPVVSPSSSQQQQQQQQQQLPRSQSGGVVGAPRRIQPSLLSGSSSSSNSNTFTNKQLSPVQQQQHQQQHQQKRIQPTAAKSNNNNNNNNNINNEASVETPEYILDLAKAYAFALEWFHNGDIEKSIVDVLKMLSISPDAFPFGVSPGKEAEEEFEIFPSGVFVRKFAALVLANAGTLPFSLGPTALEALSESEAVKAHAPMLAQECANFLSALAASATTVTKIYDDATPSASSRKRNNKCGETDNGRGGAVGTRADVSSVRNPSNKFGLVSRANAHAREKWRDQLVALLSPDAKFNASSFMASTGATGAPPSKYYHQNAANAFARKCREVFDSAKSKEDARWLADVFVRKMLKSAGEGETEEDIGAAVSAAKLSALRERLMGGGGVSTSAGAQHQNPQRHNNTHANGRSSSSLGRGSNSILGGGRGVHQGRGGGGAGGRGGGRGNHHVAPTPLALHQQQSNETSSSTTTTTTTTQESSFAAMFQPAFRPYVCVLETADSARFSAAVSRSLADALKALDNNYAASVRKGKGEDGVSEGGEEVDDILRSFGVNPKDFTARALAAKCCGKFLGLLRFCLDGYSSIVAFDGLPTIELCVESLRIATAENELMLTLPWVSEYVKFTPWEDTEEATLVFSSKGFVDLTSWFRSASKSAKLCIVNTSNGSNGATGSAPSRSLRSVEDVSLISAVSVRMIRHLVRETLHFKAPTTTAKSLEYAKLASTSQSHPAGPVPKAFLANAFDKVKISVEENDVLAEWGSNSAAGGHDFTPNVIDDSLLQKLIGVDVERCITALRNDDAISNRWSQEEIESIESQISTHQAAAILPSKQEQVRKGEDEGDRHRVVPVPVRKIAPVSATALSSTSPPTKITSTKMAALETSPSLPSVPSSSTANPTRSLQRAFLAANPRHKNIVDFTVDAAVLASVDHAVRHEIPNALKCVSETLDNACRLAATVSAAEQKRLFMNTNTEHITQKKKMAKPTLEDAWSSAFETAIERATMLALREIGGVIEKRAADDAAKRAGAAAAALLREPSDDDDDGDDKNDGKMKKKSRAPLSPEASASAAVARDAARQSATERSRLSAPFELRKAIVDEASRKLRVALKNLSSDERGEDGEDEEEEENNSVVQRERKNTTPPSAMIINANEKETCDENDENDENLVADVQSAALSAIARALSEAQGWAPGSLLAVSRELANARNPGDEVGAKELARMCENCSNSIRSVLALDETWRDALFASQQQQKQNAAAVLSSSSAMSPSDAALGPNALSTAAALLAKPSDAPGKAFKKNAEAGRPRDALARALCALARASMALFLAPPQPALIKPDRHGGVSLSSALVSSAAASSGADNNSSNSNAASGGNTDGTKQNIGWGVSRDGVCESVRLAVLNAFALASPILETLDAFAPPDAISVWNEVCGELLFPKNWIPVLRVFPHSPFAQLRIETIVCDVFASVPDGKAATLRLKKFLETQFAFSSSEAPLSAPNKTTINAMGTSLLLRFLVKLLDARIERYREEEDKEEEDKEEEDKEEEEKKASFSRKRDKLRRLEDELKGWEKILPSARFVSRDGPNARAPHFASKIERRIFEFSKIILSLKE